MSQPPMNDRELEALWQDASHWHFDVLYYAPTDPRVFVPKRGRSWSHQTLNWGRPASWGIAVVSVLPGLLVAAFALWATG